ncbi:MAG TPA: peptide chain release factor N(5)-glutamine methyltransferase [Marinospirillum sp.]|uniref:peptide chain release factor N(5)-glutamine methyltransferase n=1 Tax=Marinospirillum sp. TaxID=2183934 RepID=UPI002B4A0393|nr:peptide chain release factor N(5)-glutamine methyltransferase [Marinospirillum sp.]HKM14337.1 peptide chain release factor N(5)-glutamine methyltransferase [Marinospirillum sp.]
MPNTINLGQWLSSASQQLKQAGLDNARQEADYLLSHLLQKNTAYLYTRPELALETEQQLKLNTWLAERIAGKPLAWILGEWDFWGLTLEVSPATLIPRADTERLVELALQLSIDKPKARVLDMGTGTGAIALAIKKERPNWQVDAVDFKLDAVSLARKNARQLELDIRVWQSDWWQQIPPQTYDLILSNPPYIHPQDPHLSQGDLRFEPKTALVGGKDGLQAYRDLLVPIQQRLTQGGYLLVEHGYDQAAAIAELFNLAELNDIKNYKDYADQPRATLGCRS